MAGSYLPLTGRFTVFGPALVNLRLPLRQDESGTIRVDGSKVTFDAVVYAFRDGATAEEIADRYPALSLPAVYAALTFYLQNREEVDAYLERHSAEAIELRDWIEARPGYSDFRDRLLSRMRRSD